MSSWQWLPAAFPMGIMVGALVLTGFGMDAGKNIFNKKVRACPKSLVSLALPLRWHDTIVSEKKQTNHSAFKSSCIF